MKIVYRAETTRVVTLAKAEAAVRSAVDALVDEYRTQLATAHAGLLGARARADAFERENDAMRQLFTAWMMVDELPPEQRADLERRTAALGGSRFVKGAANA